MTGIQIHGVWGGYLGLFPGGIGKQGLEAAEQETMSSDPHRAVSLKVWDFFLRPLRALRTRVWKCEFPRDWICLPWPALGSSVCLHPQPKGTESPMDNLERESEERPFWMQRRGSSCVRYDAGFLSWLRPRQGINILWKLCSLVSSLITASRL